VAETTIQTILRISHEAREIYFDLIENNGEMEDIHETETK